MKPKLFNEQEVLDKVIELFWQHGFDGTSMQMLQECMGLSRASIYHTFENKNELFRQALMQYLHKIGKLYEECLNSSDDICEAIHCLLTTITQSTRFPRGCLLALSTLEMSQHEASTQKIIRMAHAQMHTSLYNRLKKSGSDDAENIAHVLCVFIQGLLVMHKAGVPLSSKIMSSIEATLHTAR